MLLHKLLYMGFYFLSSKESGIFSVNLTLRQKANCNFLIHNIYIFIHLMIYSFPNIYSFNMYYM